MSILFRCNECGNIFNNSEVRKLTLSINAVCVDGSSYPQRGLALDTHYCVGCLKEQGIDAQSHTANMEESASEKVMRLLTEHVEEVAYEAGQEGASNPA